MSLKVDHAVISNIIHWGNWEQNGRLHFFYTFAAIIDGDRALPAGIQKFTNKIIKRNTVDTDLI